MTFLQKLSGFGVKKAALAFIVIGLLATAVAAQKAGATASLAFAANRSI
jgi:hypothetical protein